jgi:pyrroline-5-carboxylate reductase
MSRLAVVGAGVMGETIMAGLLASGWQPEELVAVDRYPERVAEVVGRHGVGSAASIDEAVARAEAVLLAVKPQDARGVLAEIGAALRPGAAVVSICAGISAATIEAALPAGTPVVRVMPNTPAKVGEGMSAISAGSAATGEHLELASSMLGSIGKVVTVPESYQDAVTAVSGSGPAYVFYVVEAMVDAGVLLGLPRDVATTLAVQTLYGSAKLLVTSGEHPGRLREQVTSPGGTTAAALRELDAHAVKAAFAAAMEACRDRSRELAG